MLPLEQFDDRWPPAVAPRGAAPVFVERVSIRDALLARSGNPWDALTGRVELVEPTFQVFNPLGYSLSRFSPRLPRYVMVCMGVDLVYVMHKLLSSHVCLCVLCAVLPPVPLRVHVQIYKVLTWFTPISPPLKAERGRQRERYMRGRETGREADTHNK